MSDRSSARRGSGERRPSLLERVQDLQVGLRVRANYFRHRALDPLLLVTFVNMVPADIRLKPEDEQESRLLIALDPALRDKMIKVFVPLRALDFFCLSCAAML